MLAVAERGNGNDGHERCDERIDDGIDNEDQRQDFIGAFQQPQRRGGRLVAAFGHVPQTVPVGGHQGCFGHGKQRGKQNQDKQEQGLRPYGNGIHRINLGELACLLQQF